MPITFFSPAPFKLTITCRLTTAAFRRTNEGAAWYIKPMADVVIPYVKDLRFEYGVLEQVSPNVRRLIARNPSPFTYAGTGTYVVGHGRVAVIDPGPDSPEHIENLLAALGSETVSHILITHTHLDHSPGARLLVERTGATTYGFGPHARSQRDDGVKVEEGADFAFTPDERLTDGAVISGPDYEIEAVHTPGHCSNHLCFQLQNDKTLFSGDHVMGWSTSVISPPDGNMADYLRSLALLLERDDERYFPTHGAPITKPKRLVESFIAHRQAREEQILQCLAQGTTTIREMVPKMYVGVNPVLYPAAARSVFAHVLHMIEEGKVQTEGEPTLGGTYRLG